MTDLEHLWDDYPVGPVPTSEILRAARRGVAARRRRALTRPLLVAGTVLALGAAFLGGTLVHGSGVGSGAGSSAVRHAGPDASRPVAFQADLPAATSCGQLLASYVDRGLADVTAWGWGGGSVSDLMDSARVPTMDSFAAVPAPVRQTSSATGTNVQEAGVDEPDVVKTDGDLLVRVQDDDLLVDDVTGAAPVQVASLALPRISDPDLLLAGDTVIALGADATAPAGTDGHGTAGTRVLTISLADPAKPTISADVAYSSALLSARQHGDVVRLVLSAGLPDLGFVQPTDHRTRKQALAANRALVQHSTIADWLPTYDDGSGGAPLLDCHNVAIPPDRLGLDTVSVVGFDVSAPTRPTAIGLAGAATIAYESADDLYLAATPATASSCGECVTPLASGAWTGRVPAGGDSTDVFDFALRGDTATHVASGQVRGIVADRWSMDSADGTLRLAVGRSSSTGDFNSIVTLRRQGTALVEAGRLDHLGRGEDIEAVRWFDDLAILVTYRQTDPMYAVDLSDATRPRLLGELRLPGFSSYLHPLGGKRMIGVGETTTSEGRDSAEVGLFDVSDLTRVRRLDVHPYGAGTTAVASTDPRAFTWLPDHRTVLTVVQHGRAGYLSVLRLHGGRLHNSMVPVGYGREVSLARTVELPDGRVLLVTGAGVSVLPL